MAALKRLARSAPALGVDAVVENGCCAVGTADCRCWSAPKRDCRVGPSRDVIRLAMLGGLERAGNGACGIGGAARGGTPKAGLGGNGVGGAPRCTDCAWKTISAAIFGSTSGYSDELLAG